MRHEVCQIMNKAVPQWKPLITGRMKFFNWHKISSINQFMIETHMSYVKEVFKL